MDWEKWVDGHINYQDSLEKKLAALSPEGIIRNYYSSLERHEMKEAYASRTRNYMAEQLFFNCPSDQLYRQKLDNFESCIKKVTIISVERMQDDPSLKGSIEYLVMADYRWKGDVYEHDGRHPRYFVLKKETSRSGWRIESLGTGP